MNVSINQCLKWDDFRSCPQMKARQFAKIDELIQKQTKWLQLKQNQAENRQIKLTQHSKLNVFRFDLPNEEQIQFKELSKGSSDAGSPQFAQEYIKQLLSGYEGYKQMADEIQKLGQIYCRNKNGLSINSLKYRLRDTTRYMQILSTYFQLAINSQKYPKEVFMQHKSSIQFLKIRYQTEMKELQKYLTPAQIKLATSEFLSLDSKAISATNNNTDTSDNR